MKAYGYSRNAKLECRFGCCTKPDAGKQRDARKSTDAARRKAARRISPRVFSDLIEG
jgi:hypothetical protein